MREYSLRFHEGSAKNPRTITFQSEDAREVFSIMERENLRGAAELYDGDRSLGTIAKTLDGGWILESRQNLETP